MRFIIAIIIATMCGLNAHAASVQLKVWRISPLEGSVLPKFGTVYLEIGYDSDVPLRLQAEAFMDGKAVEKGQSMNASVAHPSGHGTGLVWVSFHEPAEIDTIVVTAYDENWTELNEVRVPRRSQWASQPASSRSEIPSWVQSLINNERVIATQYAIDHPPSFSPFASITTIIAFLSVPGYFLLQPYALFALPGRWRLAALIPLGLMVPAGLHAAWALSDGSNIWPIVLIFAAPFGFFFLTGLIAAHRLRSSNVL